MTHLKNMTVRQQWIPDWSDGGKPRLHNLRHAARLLSNAKLPASTMQQLQRHPAIKARSESAGKEASINAGLIHTKIDVPPSRNGTRRPVLLVARDISDVFQHYSGTIRRRQLSLPQISLHDFVLDHAHMNESDTAVCSSRTGVAI
jgi:hypothetical protein